MGQYTAGLAAPDKADVHQNPQDVPTDSLPQRTRASLSFAADQNGNQAGSFVPGWNSPADASQNLNEGVFPPQPHYWSVGNADGGSAPPRYDDQLADRQAPDVTDDQRYYAAYGEQNAARFNPGLNSPYYEPVDAEQPAMDFRGSQYRANLGLPVGEAQESIRVGNSQMYTNVGAPVDNGLLSQNGYFDNQGAASPDLDTDFIPQGFYSLDALKSANGQLYDANVGLTAGQGQGRADNVDARYSSNIGVNVDEARHLSPIEGVSLPAEDTNQPENLINYSGVLQQRQDLMPAFGRGMTAHVGVSARDYQGAQQLPEFPASINQNAGDISSRLSFDGTAQAQQLQRQQQQISALLDREEHQQQDFTQTDQAYNIDVPVKDKPYVSFNTAKQTASVGVPINEKRRTVLIGSHPAYTNVGVQVQERNYRPNVLEAQVADKTPIGQFPQSGGANVGGLQNLNQHGAGAAAPESYKYVVSSQPDFSPTGAIHNAQIPVRDGSQPLQLNSQHRPTYSVQISQPTGAARAGDARGIVNPYVGAQEPEPEKVQVGNYGAYTNVGVPVKEKPQYPSQQESPGYGTGYESQEGIFQSGYQQEGKTPSRLSVYNPLTGGTYTYNTQAYGDNQSGPTVPLVVAAGGSINNNPSVTSSGTGQVVPVSGPDNGFGSFDERGLFNPWTKNNGKVPLPLNALVVGGKAGEFDKASAPTQQIRERAEVGVAVRDAVDAYGADQRADEPSYTEFDAADGNQFANARISNYYFPWSTTTRRPQLVSNSRATAQQRAGFLNPWDDGRSSAGARVYDDDRQGNEQARGGSTRYATTQATPSTTGRDSYGYQFTTQTPYTGGGDGPTIDEMLTDIDVQCDTERRVMAVNLHFKRQFTGLVYAREYFNTPGCTSEILTSADPVVEFPLDGCGVQEAGDVYDTGTAHQAFANTIVVMNDRQSGVLGPSDRAYTVSCSTPIIHANNVAVQTGVAHIQGGAFETSPVPLPDIYLKVVAGKDPRSSPSSTLVVGELASIVVHYKDTGNWDIWVTDCYAHSGTPLGKVNLIDTDGCPINKQLIGAFNKNPRYNNNGETYVYAVFKSFKFPDKDNVYFECNVNVCKNKCRPRTCDDESRSRRKRSTDEAQSDVTKITNVYRGLKIILPGEHINGQFPIGMNAPGYSRQNSRCISKSTLAISLTLMLLLLLVFVSVAFFLGMRRKYRQGAPNMHEMFEMPTIHHKP